MNLIEMNFEDMGIAVVIAWTLIWSVIAVSLVSSVSNWVLVVGMGVLPGLILLWMWQRTAQTLPANIHEARK